MTRPILGIDLGTSNTVAAVVDGSQVVLVTDRDGRRIHPSVVSFHPGGSVLVGEEAKQRRVIDPASTISSVKRLIGRSIRSSQVRTIAERAPYQLVEGDNEEALIVARGQTFSAAQISGLILRHVRALAEAQFNSRLEQAVITVPANFNDAQRAATREAGRLAGLEVLRILNEPTAAALAYGYGRELDTRIVVYDFGGGTFDVTALQLDDNVFEVLSTAGDTFLGGDDIDAAIVEHMIQLFLQQNRVDLGESASVRERLRSVAEQVKCRLSSQSHAVVEVREVAYGSDGVPLDLHFELSADELNRMTRDTVQRSFVICDEAMGLAELSATQIDDIVLVGGTTRMPLVREGVHGYFGIEPRTDLNPDEVVAMGAAIQGAALASSGFGGRSNRAEVDAVLLDVTPRALGVATVGGYAETIIERNAQIPLEQTRRFTTGQDYQQTVRIRVCQGESRLYAENQPLGELVLEQLRPDLRGRVQLEVTFEIDTDGILQVHAVDADTGQRQSAHVQLVGTTGEGEDAELPPLPPDDLPEPA